jgi:hypothetical protein
LFINAVPRIDSGLQQLLVRKVFITKGLFFVKALEKDDQKDKK